MKSSRYLLFLLASLFAAPVVMADEIGSGTPEENSASSTASVPAGGIEAECTSWSCAIAEFLGWFE